MDDTKNFDQHLEELSILGYTVIENVIAPSLLTQIKTKLVGVYETQEREHPNDIDLNQSSERNIVRVPFAYDDLFLDLLSLPSTMEYIKAVLGNYFILNTQNGVIVDPNLPHSQSIWHRDFSHLDFVSSPPLAVNAFYCITDFSEQTGATQVLPYSHKLDFKPSDDYIRRHGVTVTAPAGSVFLFDTMMYHRTGYNRSDTKRIGINHVYVKYFLKQQIDIPSLMRGKSVPTDEFMRMLLGIDSRVPLDVNEFRRVRHESNERKKNKK